MAIERGRWYRVDEQSRTYIYKEAVLKILNVTAFKVTEHGRHWLQKRNNKVVIMRKGWLGIKVDPKDIVGMVN